MSRDRRRFTALDGSVVAVVAIAVATLRRHLDVHPAVAVSRVLRAIPARVRPAVAQLVERVHPGWAPLALAAAGHRERATSAIVQLAVHQRHRVSAAAAALALHDGEAARQVLAIVGTEAPDERYARGLCLSTLGFLAEADAAVVGDTGPRVRTLRRRLRAEAAMLGPTGRDPLLPLPLPSPSPSLGSTTAPVVLHLVTNALPETQAGYTTRTQGIVHALRSQGIDARVAPRVGFPVTDGHLRARDETEVDGVPYHRSLPCGLPTDVQALAVADADARGRLARSLGAQVMHAHSNYLNARAAFAERDRTGIPVIYEVRGMLEETWRSRGGDPAADRYQLVRASETEAMLAADAVVVISDVLRDQVLARGVAVDRVATVPNAVDDRFLLEPPTAGPLRGELGFADEDVVIGTVSTLNDYEGLDVLVEAVGLLRGEGLPVRLLLVGAGPAGPGLEHQAAKLGHGVAVLPGRVPFADVHRYHAAIDVFAVPRLDLPVTALVPPLKPLEAMATGRPVVASDLPPLREMVKPGVTGELARAGDAQALAQTMLPLVADPSRRSELGANARDWAHTERTWHRAAQRYREIYYRLGVG